LDFSRFRFPIGGWMQHQVALFFILF
ncbi:uncharacterized protein METZ01_LOCUS442124, partial [marine metagenome]